MWKTGLLFSQEPYLIQVNLFICSEKVFPRGVYRLPGVNVEDKAERGASPVGL
jgi:hypothetical protein